MARPTASHMPRGATAPKILLSTRSHIAKVKAGLKSVGGAQEVISEIKTRKTVTNLDLSDNELGDDGCAELFRYLSSNEGSRYKIAEISLKSNNIGDRGLTNISDYLAVCSNLRTLRLQNVIVAPCLRYSPFMTLIQNSFNPNPEAVVKFTSALNASHLTELSLASNIQLADEFADVFLTHLDAPHLRSLDLSMIGLTPLSTDTLVSFLSSPRSAPLEAFKCNSNRLTSKSIHAMIEAIRRANFTLLQLEMYTNDFGRVDFDGHEDGALEMPQWEVANNSLKKVLLRNALLMYQTQESAVKLLPIARALLLQPVRHSQVSPSDVDGVKRETEDNISPSLPHLPSLNPTLATSTVFPFRHLPTELQLHILTFLGPLLSSSQLTRIFKYASDPSTLPALLPRLRGSGCIPDPSILTFGVPKSSGCGGGQCMGAGSVLCHRTKERGRWLAEIGCEKFEVDEPRRGGLFDVINFLREEPEKQITQSPAV